MNKERSVIYIAGGISEISPEETKAKFGKAQEHLENLGFVVLNPHNIYLGKRGKWGDYMQICLPMLDKADGIYMLDNWRESSGATMEFAYALKTNKMIDGDVDNKDITKFHLFSKDNTWIK